MIKLTFKNAGKFLKIEDVDVELVSDFKLNECELWEWRNPDLSMSFQQLIDSRTIPQEKMSSEIEELNGIVNSEDLEGRNLKINTNEIIGFGNRNESHLSQLFVMVESNTGNKIENILTSQETNKE